jgi:hypothetical protein
MSDPVTSARSARESLARALAALQSDPSVPPQLIAVAEPVSQAMGALFQIEKTGGAATPTSGPTALDAVRRALSLLQQQPSTHPAVQAALEAVAGSLGLVHGLATPKAPGPKGPEPAPPVPAPAPPQRAQPAPQPQAYAPQQQQPNAYAPTAFQPDGNPAFAAAQPARQAPPQAAPQTRPQPAQPAAPQPAPNTGGGGAGIRVEAELGTHSPSNFYKGLSGNDVIEHGGLFVATYNIPRIGAPVALRISMPGGYEFEATGIVRWTRETVDSSAGRDAAQPGFGAQLTQITQEGRQLVYRYVRNREPLFHDDL